MNLVTDAAGAVVESTQHVPFGAVHRRDVAQSPEPPAQSRVAHTFTGQRFDASTGLLFYHARYYDPTLGRFLSADPTVQRPGDPQDLNRYAYARNNPVNHVDPSGYGWKKIFGWVSTALSFLLPPLAPFLMLANLGLGLYNAVQTGNWGSFIGSVVGSAIGADIFSGIGQGFSLGITNYIGTAALNGGFGGFLSGAISGAVEFGLAGFGSGFGGALGSGASLRESFKAGGLSAAVTGALGAGIQGSYLGRLQTTLHGNSIETIAQGQGWTLLQNGAQGLPFSGLPPEAASAAATRTRKQMGAIHPARLFPWGLGINRSVELNHFQAAGILAANNERGGVYANWMSDARTSAQLVSGRKPELHDPFSHGRGRPGYYWHYHPLTVDGQKMDSHAWFGSPTQ